MTSLDTRHLEIGRRIELGVRSMPRSILIYGVGALIGAVALTALEVATRIAPETAPVKISPVVLPIKDMPVDEKPAPVPVKEDQGVTYVAREPAKSLDVTAIRAPTMVVSLPPATLTSTMFASATSPIAADLPASSAFLMRMAQIKRPLGSLVEWTAFAWDGDAFPDPMMRLAAQENTFRKTMRLVGTTPSVAPFNGGFSAQMNTGLFLFPWGTEPGNVVSNAMSKAAAHDASPSGMSVINSVSRPVSADVFYPALASDSVIVTK